MGAILGQQGWLAPLGWQSAGLAAPAPGPVSCCSQSHKGLSAAS